MATVTGKTSVKIDGLLAQTLVSGALDSEGALTFTRKNGAVIQAGSLGASIVDATIDSSKHLIFTTMGGQEIDAGSIVPNLLAAWPIGAIYVGTTSTNPNTLLGGGTWVRYAEGRVIVGVDPTQTEFDSLGETGGEKTHTLTEAELAEHDHDTNGGGSHDHHMATSANTGGSNFYMPRGGGGTLIADSADSPTTQTGSTHNHDITASGGGQPHNNLQPYITAYIWRRTA